jgi:RNA recognition motif-containing protein
MSNLLLINRLYNVSDREIREWIESRGIGTKSIRVVRDLVTGASPSFGHVELKSSTALKEAIFLLDGNECVIRPSGNRRSRLRIVTALLRRRSCLCFIAPTIASAE